MKRYWQKIVLWIFSSLLRTKPLKHVKSTLYREARTLPKTWFMRLFPNLRQQNAKMQTKHLALRNVLSKTCLLSVYELLTYEIGNTRAKHFLWRNRKKKKQVFWFFFLSFLVKDRNACKVLDMSKWNIINGNVYYESFSASWVTKR